MPSVCLGITYRNANLTKIVRILYELTCKKGGKMKIKNATGNTKIRVEHKREVLNYIRQFAPVSRTEIFEKTNISKPTVTRVIEELMSEGFLIETGTIVESSAGRRPVQIVLNPSARYCIGVNLSRNNLRIAIVDFTLKVVSKNTTSIRDIQNLEEFLEKIYSGISSLIDETGIKKDTIIGIGVGVPGIVDTHTGVVLDFAQSHKLTGIPLVERLSNKFNLPVFIENNANTRVLGEYWYGYGSGHQNIIYVICSEGIGSGIITEGRLLCSKNNVISGLGHMTVNVDGRKCRCGRDGCIEAYCSMEAVLSLFQEQLRSGKYSSVLEKVNGNIEEVDFNLICKAGDEGDSLCVETLTNAAGILASGLANLIGIFGPELIIISGEMVDLSEYFYRKVQEMTQSKLIGSLDKNVDFIKRKVSDSLYEIGAATLVYREFFRE